MLNNCIRLALLPGLLLLASCSDCPCVDANLHPNFVSFTPEEIKRVVLKRYARDGAFSMPLDTAVFFDEQDYRMAQSGDTISFPVRVGNFSLDPNFDWMISLPVLNRSFQISAVDKEQITGDCSGKVQCVNPVRSLKINGTLQSLRETYLNFYIPR